MPQEEALHRGNHWHQRWQCGGARARRRRRRRLLLHVKVQEEGVHSQADAAPRDERGLSKRPRRVGANVQFEFDDGDSL